MNKPKKKPFFRAFWSNFNEKITVKFFAKDQGKTHNYTFTIKKLLLIGTIFLTMMVLSAHYLITETQRQELLEKIEQDNIGFNKQVDKLEERINTINEYQHDYNTQMLKVYQNFGDINDESIWEKAARSEDVKLITDTWGLANDNWLKKVPDANQTSIEKINQSRIQLLLGLNQLKEIDQYMLLVDKISDNIPLGWPVKGKRGYKTSGFGTRLSPFKNKREFHTGVDIAAAAGSELVATADGKVLFAGEKGSFGNVVIIRHKYGYRTIYGHNEKNLVRNGQSVKRGQIIALVGSTGRSTGPHIHYEIRIGRTYVDPWPYVIGNW